MREVDAIMKEVDILLLDSIRFYVVNEGEYIQ